MRELIERIEAADRPGRELDFEIAKAAGWTNKAGAEWGICSPHWYNQEQRCITELTWSYGPAGAFLPAFTESIDAALTLLPEGWVVGSLEWWPKRPHGAGVTLLETGRIEGFDGYDASVHRKTSAQAATPALALVAAILRARGEG